MGLIFFGSSRFSIAPFKKIYEEKEEISAVFTLPNKPKGRGRKLLPTPLKAEAEKLLLPLHEFSSFKKETLNLISSLSPELIVVVAFGKILPKEIIEIPSKGSIALHPSLLPELRGPAPIPWAIMLGKKKTGVTTFFMNEKVDSGDIILQEEINILPDDTAFTLEGRLSNVGAKILLETIKTIRKGNFSTKKQKGNPTYAPFLTKKMGEINWGKNADEIKNLVRAFNPWPTAYTFLSGKRLILWKVEVESRDKTGKPGEVIKVEKDKVFISSGDGIISLKEVQIEGRRKMTIEEFLKGNKIKEGIMLGRK